MTPRAKFLSRLVIDNDLTGADDCEYLEAHEAADWLKAEPRSDYPADTLTSGLWELSPADRARFSRLLIACLDGITVDQLVELRDLIRQALLDQCLLDVHAALESDVDFDRVAWDREREGRAAAASYSHDMSAELFRNLADAARLQAGAR